VNLVLFEDAGYSRLLPLVWLRPVWQLRCGRDRLIDKIQTHFGLRLVDVFCRPELADVVFETHAFIHREVGAAVTLVNGRLLVRGDVSPPAKGTAWVADGELLAATIEPKAFDSLDADLFVTEERLGEWISHLKPEAPPAEVGLIRYPWDLVGANAGELERQCREGGRIEGEVAAGAHLLHVDAIRVGAGAKISPGVVLDAEAGPIHIEPGVRIEPQVVVQGPCFLGRDSIVRAGAVLREGMSIGPVCRVGGECAASIFQGYANKQHDGFLGHSFVGSWVNLGADTVTSDLKNTYGTIRVAINGQPVESGQRFVGSCIGDHSKTGIGTILPTGCVIGVASNVFTQAGVPKFVPSFAWLTMDGMSRYRVDKAVEIARTVMDRRGCALSDAQAALLRDTAARASKMEAAGWC